MYNLHYEQFADGTVKCIEDEIPFELPNGWAWTSINNIAFVTKLAGFEYTKNIAPNLCETGIPLFKGKNVQDSKIIYEFESYIPECVSDELLRSQINRKCILTPYVGTIGNIGIHNKSGKFHLGSNVGKIELFNTSAGLMEEYVVTYLKSNFGFKQLTKHMKATAQASISIEAIRDVYIPMPPEKEQQRLWLSLSEVLKQIENINTLSIDISNIITTAKSKILDLAIRGKLVPQNPDDEPASILLERIRAEKEDLIKQGKIKRDKKESFIFKGEDNSYYDVIIPQSWEITNLSDVTLNISDGSHNPPPKKNKGVPLLSATNIYDNKINYTSATRWITEDEWIIENARTKIEVGDVLITIVGTIGRTAVVSDTTRFALQRSVAVMKPNMIDSKYLMYVLQAPMIIDWLNANAKGNAQVGIYLKDLAKLSFPLPPLAEQKRIVEAIGTVFSQLDEILNSIS